MRSTAISKRQIFIHLPVVAWIGSGVVLFIQNNFSIHFTSFDLIFTPLAVFIAYAGIIRFHILKQIQSIKENSSLFLILPIIIACLYPIIFFLFPHVWFSLHDAHALAFAASCILAHETNRLNPKLNR
jgi:hypothetical protein